MNICRVDVRKPNGVLTWFQLAGKAIRGSLGGPRGKPAGADAEYLLWCGAGSELTSPVSVTVGRSL